MADTASGDNSSERHLDSPETESKPADARASAGLRASRTPAGPVAGAAVELRKAHACGGTVWLIARVGADIGLQCRTCGRRIFLTRDEFNRRVKHSTA
jgi:hypothetical protein